MSILTSGLDYGRREWKSLLWGRPLRGGETTLEPPCFIVGSGRCGTTLLRAILITSPKIHIPPETHVLGGIIDEYRLFNRLPWSFVVRQALSRLEFQPNFDMFEVSLRDLYLRLVRLPVRERTLSSILNGVYLYHAEIQKPSASRWGDKTPGNAVCLDRLLKVFPEMKAVHLIRDGRDVVRSFTEMEGGLDLEAATERWMATIQRLRDFRRRHDGICIEVRYEDLVSQPEREVKRVCDFIRLEFEDGMLRHNEAGSRSADIMAYPHHQNVLEPISSKSIGKWKRTFDRQTVDRLDLRMGPLLAELGDSQ